MAFHQLLARPANAEFPQNAIEFLDFLPEKTQLCAVLGGSYIAQRSLYWAHLILFRDKTVGLDLIGERQEPPANVVQMSIRSAMLSASSNSTPR